MFMVSFGVLAFSERSGLHYYITTWRAQDGWVQSSQLKLMSLAAAIAETNPATLARTFRARVDRHAVSALPSQVGRSVRRERCR
jgi:hypothetical protein